MNKLPSRAPPSASLPASPQTLPHQELPKQSLSPGMIPRGSEALSCPRRTLSSAIAWNTSSWQIASVSGPMAGGLLYGLGGAVAYGAGTVLLAAAFALMLAVPRGVEEPSTSHRKTLASLFAGFAYVRSEPVVLGAISRVRSTLGAEAACVLSGGAAKELAARISAPLLQVDNLVLEGLARFSAAS